MKKRWLIGIGAVVLIGAVVSLALPATIYVPLGYMRHEAFYEGKPASYWARGFQRDGFYGRWSPPGDVGKEFARQAPQQFRSFWKCSIIQARRSAGRL